VNKIGKYEVLEKIGEGGFARVYKVQHPVSRDILALKWMLDASEFDARNRSYADAFQARFIEDARTLMRLGNVPGVVRVFDLDMYEDRPFYTMELMSESLADRLGENEQPTNPVDQVTLLHIVHQVLETLIAIHDLGVIHRDLKPGNVLLNGDQAKISDFGLAKREGGSRVVLSQVGMALGSDYYAAPEQLINAKEVDERADLFSVGVILYRGLCGQYPQLSMRRFYDLPTASNYPNALVDLIDLLLEPDPKNRLPSAQAALDKFNTIREETQPTSVKKVSPVSPRPTKEQNTQTNYDLSGGCMAKYNASQRKTMNVFIAHVSALKDEPLSVKVLQGYVAVTNPQNKRVMRLYPSDRLFVAAFITPRDRFLADELKRRLKIPVEINSKVTASTDRVRVGLPWNLVLPNLDLTKVLCELMDIPKPSISPDENLEDKMKYTLHEAMCIVLQEEPNHTATPKHLSEEIYRRGLYLQKAGTQAPASQMRLRAKNYGHLFELLSDPVRIRLLT
jgi:serine/threonine protein kinase